MVCTKSVGIRRRKLRRAHCTTPRLQTRTKLTAGDAAGSQRRFGLVSSPSDLGTEPKVDLNGFSGRKPRRSR